MSFEKLIRIPNDRVGVLIGRSGKTKNMIEQKCSILLEIDSENGEVTITGNGSLDDSKPFKAMEIVTAIGRGFSPENAMILLNDENTLHVINLQDFVGKSHDQLERIKGRIIGDSGKARRNMENLSNTVISVYGKTVSVIGAPDKLKIAIDAISSLSQGSMHNAVYGKLESARRHEKDERMKLWEDQDGF